MTTLSAYAQVQLSALAASHQRRVMQESACEGTHLLRDGVQYLSFSGNDYLGLAQHPNVRAEAEAALRQYGAGAGASRLVTGNHPLYAPLEEALAASKQAEAALVFGSGYLANIGTIPALVGAKDIIFADKLVHACLLDGAQLSGASLKRFRHNDLAHLDVLLTEHRSQYKNALILVDHVYSMDGDIAPLDALSALARAHDAWLMVDDAHGLGMVKSDVPVDVWMGTLSKSAGSYGGYVIASQAVIDLLVNRARSVVFSTGLPPASCAAALAALNTIAREPERGQRALAHARNFAAALQLPEPQSAIVPLILGTEEAALAASEALKAQSILAVAIRPPTVPVGTARLRFTFSAAHSEAEVEQLIAAVTCAGLVRRTCAA